MRWQWVLRDGDQIDGAYRATGPAATVFGPTQWFGHLETRSADAGAYGRRSKRPATTARRARKTAETGASRSSTCMTSPARATRHPNRHPSKS